MTTTTLIDLGLTWVATKLRGRDVRTAEATPAFWDLWRDHKNRVKAEGFGVYKPNGHFVVVDNNERDPAKLAATAEIAASSQAIDAPEGYDIPAPEGLSYLPYQRGGIKALEERHSALLADPMGLGKTIQICGLLNKIPAELRTVLVVVPASLKINWYKEATRWLVIPRRIDILNGSGKIEGIDPANIIQSVPADPDILVVNYDVLAKHSEKLTSRIWDCVVFDESHYLKNPKAARTIHALKIRARRRYALTGTPVPNRPIELQPILGYLDPDNFGHFFSFAKRYADAQRGRFGWDFNGSSNLDELRKRLRSSLMIRREKAEVLTDLPSKRRQVIVLPADKYSDVLRAERSADRVDEALSEALTMIESGGSVEFSEMSEVRHQTALAKVSAVIDHLEGITEPVVVFAHHHDVMAELAEGLRDAGRTVVMLHGKHSTEERDQAVRDFQEGRADVFIGGMKAAGVGITLTRASVCVFAEIDWTPATLDQAEDRLHRIGQHSPVLCQHLVIDQSLDHRVIELVVNKQGVIGEVVQKQTERELAKISAPMTLEALAAELVAEGKFEVSKPREDTDLDLSPVIDGLYAVPGGDSRLKVRISRGRQGGKWAGTIFVQDAAVYGQHKKYGMQRPDATYQGAIADALRAILADPFEASKEYGRLTSTCGVCGRALEDEISVANGIGPICAGKFG